MLPTNEHLVLVTGAHGFIASHVVTALLQAGCRVRAVDIVSRDIPPSSLPHLEICTGNLCDLAFCRQVMNDVHTVMHFAANMGGMGTIHADNDFHIFRENNAMVINLISAAKDTGVKQFLFASSACVYPNILQDDPNVDSPLKEEDAYLHPPPHPQGLYGLEKLVAELLLHQQQSSMSIRIARFHNVYGPGGAWMNGREKAPAALLRKALAIKLRGALSATMEIWGDGTQRRSFLYISDCVDAILQLLSSDVSQPVNIGSNISISINDLAKLSLRLAGVDLDDVTFEYSASKPVGVASRNSDNNFVHRSLGWQPKVTLEEGLSRTLEWMQTEMQGVLLHPAHTPRDAMLEQFSRSVIVNIEAEKIIFAILLPITSRGSNSPQDCLANLKIFAQSLVHTTWRDLNKLGGVSFLIRVYLVIDHDDHFLLDGTLNKAEEVLRSESITDIVTLHAQLPKGHVCGLWRMAAKRAWEEGCHYFVLFGDDVKLKDEGWMRDVHAKFMEFAGRIHSRAGFGCVAFTDITFPGMPTFPVVHRTHLDIFGGEVVPECFINQDGDPYLFQLYRRWGCSVMIPSRIENSVGGPDLARYTKTHASDWTFNTLTDSTKAVSRWLCDREFSFPRRLTLDVIIPCYRVQMQLLDRMLNLKTSSTCSVAFIIIIDNPLSPSIIELQTKYAVRPDIRIRVNDKNMGASYSRNRGLSESAAEWVLFLDDDVVPKGDILTEAVNSIRASPLSAGFVGNTQFPVASTIFTTAVHVAGVTFFWDIATKEDVIQADDVPWGVTANLIVRRDIKDDVLFDLDFPKTGGGEDIAFCRDKREYSLKNGGLGFKAAPKVIATHPWWSNGRRSYRRFYMWSYGDGGLIKKYPSLTYYDHAPNSAEILVLCAFGLVLGVMVGLKTACWSGVVFALKAIVALLSANVIQDLYRHLYRDASRLNAVKTSIPRLLWPIVILESSFIRMASELGRVIGMFSRGEMMLLGRRYDWFAGTAGCGPLKEERINSTQRFCLFLAILVCFF